MKIEIFGSFKIIYRFLIWFNWISIIFFTLVCFRKEGKLLPSYFVEVLPTLELLVSGPLIFYQLSKSEYTNSDSVWLKWFCIHIFRFLDAVLILSFGVFPNWKFTSMNLLHCLMCWLFSLSILASVKNVVIALRESSKRIGIWSIYFPYNFHGINSSTLW